MSWKAAGVILGFIVPGIYLGITYGIWLFVSQWSWINDSDTRVGRFTYCLDFKFGMPKIGASIIATRWPRVLSNNAFFNPVADYTAQGGVFERNLMRFRDLGYIEDLREPHGSIITGHETIPLLFLIRDMEYIDKNKKRIGTVSFTIWPGDFWRWPYPIYSNFKSTYDTSIETKIFKRSDKATKDKRCITR